MSSIYNKLIGNLVNVTGNVTNTNSLNTTNITTQDLVCTNGTGTTSIDGTFSFTANINLPTNSVLNVTTSYINGTYGYGHIGSNLVTDWIHPLPGKTITWSQFFIGRDSEQPTFTAGNVRFYKNGSTQTTVAFTGLGADVGQHEDIGSPFTTTTGDKIRIGAARTNGANGSEMVVALYGYYTVD